MAEPLALTLRYIPRPSGDRRENRWIRLEQIKPEDETLTVAQAAQAIDALFGLEPCEQGLGGGGEEAPHDSEGKPTQQPKRETFAEIMRRLMGEELCSRGQGWTARVMVLRSHRSPGYALRSESAEVIATSLVNREVRELVEFGGSTSHDLRWPYAGGLYTGLPEGAATVLGSTLNLTTPAESLEVRYRTEYEVVSLRVPVVAPADLTTSNRLGMPDLPPAAVIAFWGEFAAACELTPPPQDERANPQELAKLCRQPPSTGQETTPAECHETVEHYMACDCSGSRVNEWKEVVAVSCPEGIETRTHDLGSRQQFDGYTNCGETDEVHDREYYRQICCHYPPSQDILPRCRVSYGVYGGGAGIKPNPEYYRSIYGADVRLIPVLPEDGICGDLTVEWEVNKRNCCDGAAAPVLPDDMLVASNTDFEVHIISGGVAPFSWYGSPVQLEAKDDATGTALFHAPSGWCGTADITVVDACHNSAQMVVRSALGKWVEIPLTNAERCSPPGGPYRKDTSAGFSGGRGLSLPRGGKCVQADITGGFGVYARCASLPYSWWICPLGNKIISDFDWRDFYGSTYSVLAPGCARNAEGTIGVHYQYAYSLFQWVCP